MNPEYELFDYQKDAVKKIINSDNTLRLIETTIREEIVWDNRYNVDVQSKEGCLNEKSN